MFLFRLVPATLLAAALALPLPSAARSPASSTLAAGEAAALYEDAHRRPGFAACAHLFPAARPIDLASVPAHWQPAALCSEAFAVLHSGAAKTPLVVVQRLDAQQLAAARDQVRTNEFFADPRLRAGERAELADYRGSGLDRGHMAPAADAPTARAMAQSFALSNMVPQDRTNNSRIWAKIERDVRKYATRANGAVFSFSGPIFDAGHATIGANRVWVPTRLFKLVYDEASQRAWAWVIDNAPDAPIGRPMSYEAFVQATGWALLKDVPIKGTIAP